MDARHSTSPSIKRKAEAPADLAEVVDEAAPAQAVGVLLVVARAQVVPAEAQGLALPGPAEVLVGPDLVAAATRLQLHVEAAVRPFPA
jgi:hypothetical protein